MKQTQEAAGSGKGEEPQGTGVAGPGLAWVPRPVLPLSLRNGRAPALLGQGGGALVLSARPEAPSS